jgi:5-methylcytosine-specific restriction protein B
MTDQNGSQLTWFVGAAYERTDDQTPRFLAEGIWENGYDDKYLDLVRSMRPGDRIAIKSSYTRKHGLPFDNRGRTVSVMAIKAIGTITDNPNDGKLVRVNWTKWTQSGSGTSTLTGARFGAYYPETGRLTV